MLPSRGPEDLVIAADAGLLFLREHGIEPDLFLGDGDSLGDFRPQCANIALEEEQETNDLAKAYRFAVAHGATEIDIFGASGLREDHFLGNL